LTGHLNHFDIGEAC